MTIYVDALMDWGWKIRGRKVSSCHLFTDEIDLDNLHGFAARIGMKRSWFQDKDVPHYDLVESRYKAALSAGAIQLDRRQTATLTREIRHLHAIRRAAITEDTILVFLEDDIVNDSFPDGRYSVIYRSDRSASYFSSRSEAEAWAFREWGEHHTALVTKTQLAALTKHLVNAAADMVESMMSELDKIIGDKEDE